MNLDQLLEAVALFNYFCQTVASVALTIACIAYLTRKPS